MNITDIMNAIDAIKHCQSMNSTSVKVCLSTYWSRWSTAKRVMAK